MMGLEHLTVVNVAYICLLLWLDHSGFLGKSMGISQVFVIIGGLPCESVSFERSSCNRNCTSLGILSRADSLFSKVRFIKSMIDLLIMNSKAIVTASSRFWTLAVLIVVAVTNQDADFKFRERRDIIFGN